MSLVKPSVVHNFCLTTFIVLKVFLVDLSDKKTLLLHAYRFQSNIVKQKKLKNMKNRFDFF